MIYCTYLSCKDESSNIKHGNVGQVFNYGRVTCNSVEENPAISEWSGFTVTANYQGTIFSAALNLSDTSEYHIQMLSTINIRHLHAYVMKNVYAYINYMQTYTALYSLQMTFTLHLLPLPVLMPVHAFLQFPPQERMPTG